MSGLPGYFRHPKPVSVLLRLEGAALLLAALFAYWQLGASWWVFIVLCLAPDLSFFALAFGPRVGAAAYNVVHTTALPLAIAVVASIAGALWLVPFMAIWLAHIGADRLLGYGLKYPEQVQQTHLGPIGKAAKSG
jgi:hypothetical protein